MTDVFTKSKLERFTKKRVTIVVPDATRSLDYILTLVPLIEHLRDLKAEIRIYVALGLHRMMNVKELNPLTLISQRFCIEIKQHRPLSGALERTQSGVSFHRRAILGADLLINVGVVEAHQYAGFSGGVKGLAIGCADARSIAKMHHPFLLKNKNVGLGILEGNPFHDALWKAVEDLPDIYALLSVPGQSQIFFDKAELAFDQASKLAQKTQFRRVDELFDWMWVKPGKAKAQNFYQASRAATYLSLVKHCALKKGGTIVLEAPCPEKIGKGKGEKACAKRMLLRRDRLLNDLLNLGPDDACEGGEQRAYVLAQALKKCQIVLVGAPKMRELDAMNIQQFDHPREAIEALQLEKGKGLHVDNPFHSIPVLDTAF